MKILIIGDIYSSSGRLMVEKYVPKVKELYNINFIVANGENIAHGNGITERYYHFLLDQHVNVVTMGNHTWGNAEIFKFINDAKVLVRPLNYPEGTPGVGYVTVKYNQLTITVFQVMGRTFMNQALDCPFQATEKLLKEVKSDIYICDFHGEATSEKIAYGYHFDGRVNIIVGTHTHVQTNDARVLKNGTMYMTDLGMTGALDGVIGVERDGIIKKFLTGMPVRHNPMESGLKQFCGLVVDIDEKTRKVTKYDIINMVE
ncbi:MAG: TIGR00282 family metallophosphoesterase [Erysipelotrichaceae bacterium]|nr:TIGR00282 family metallophosphoesterase [Erysipelotrichaceae bacterium]